MQSNAILTIERRTESRIDPLTGSRGDEEVCVSKIGFIIALVITALLALVAVAIAVSCWLMAYRRRPKSAGPLPHPAEFPNPLFTTPTPPLQEPAPDYLSWSKFPSWGAPMDSFNVSSAPVFLVVCLLVNKWANCNSVTAGSHRCVPIILPQPPHPRIPELPDICDTSFKATIDPLIHTEYLLFCTIA